MVIVEIIGGISLAIALVSAVTLAIVHIKNKQHEITYICDDTFNSIGQTEIKTKCLQEKIKQTSLVLPFEEFKSDILTNASLNTIHSKTTPIINVADGEKISSSSIIYDIQWTAPLKDKIQPKTRLSSNQIVGTCEFEQGDSLSFSDQVVSVRHLIEKFENSSSKKYVTKEKNHHTDSDLASTDTNIDSQIAKVDLNQNQHNVSCHSSLSNLNITVPSSISSSNDIEKYECSSASNFSDLLQNH